MVKTNDYMFPFQINIKWNTEKGQNFFYIFTAVYQMLDIFNLIFTKFTKFINVCFSFT